MADKFKLNIISPEKKFLEGDCEFLEFVSTEGELGIYAKHIPLTTILEPCRNPAGEGNGACRRCTVAG